MYAQIKDSTAILEDAGRESSEKWGSLQTILSTMSVVLCRTNNPTPANPLQRAFETQRGSEQTSQELRDNPELR